jgi:multidrug resistance efflux pump
MTPEQPKLREDLVISRHETKEGTGFVVKDPVTGRFFRLEEVEHFVARQLNGSTPLDELRERVEGTFGVTFTAETLEQFIQALGRLGLLEKQGVDSGFVTDRPRRFRGSLLYLRLKAFDPDRLFNRLVTKVRFFFTPHFLVFSAAVILFAIGITVTNWEEIGRNIQSLYHFQALFFAWLIIFLVIIAHESAHGLACKHFGGEVHEVGFMLLYFQPAFYCNVSDAWLFPEKSKRLWVTFAGAYFEVFIWALATVTWRLTEHETWVNFLALVVMATSGIKSLFNLNPLIKLDGYYLLSDYLEVTNLRQKSFNYLSAGIKSMWGTATAARKETSRRERRIYLTYGLLAGAFSLWLLGFVTLKFGGFLVGRYQGIGFVLFMLFLLALFRDRLSKLLRLPTVLRTSRLKLAPMPQVAKFLILSATVLPLLYFGRMELKVSGEFKVLPIHNSDVRAEVEGIIDQIYADEGDVVKKGIMIARLSDRDSRADLRKIKAEIDEKQAKLRLLKAGSRQEEIAKAKAGMEKAKERVKYATERLAMYRTLYEKQMVSLKEFQEAEENAAVRLRELEEAEAELSLLLAGTRPEEIEAAEAEIARLNAQRRYIEEHIQLLHLASPISGLITTPRLKERIGQNVKKGDLIAQVHELETVRAEISVSENEIADVQVGQEVVLKARAYPGKSFYGKISSVATTAIKGDNGQPVRTILVITEIDNDSFLLKPEMTGNAKIYCGKQSIIDLVTRKFAHYIRVEFWSWW